MCHSSVCVCVLYYYYFMGFLPILYLRLANLDKMLCLLLHRKLGESQEGSIGPFPCRLDTLHSGIWAKLYTILNVFSVDTLLHYMLIQIRLKFDYKCSNMYWGNTRYPKKWTQTWKAQTPLPPQTPRACLHQDMHLKYVSSDHLWSDFKRRVSDSNNTWFCD